eukprot:5259761-Heterocapsa_arctica.AAC.1
MTIDEERAARKPVQPRKPKQPKRKMQKNRAGEQVPRVVQTLKELPTLQQPDQGLATHPHPDGGELTPTEVPAPTHADL